MSQIPKTRPVNSEDFLPPANTKHKSGDEATLKEQAADREKIVCAVGIDVHYELNVVSNETGGYKPRLKPFNPRMCGPACPYPYTGKFVEETDHIGNSEDPVALGRAIQKKDPYDKTLYAKRDPRLVSKCVVVRDYGCKIPIDLADTTRIAQAVLNHFPDQYVAFLGEFVSNLFGSSMRKFLDVQAKGLRRLLDRPEELNRISWAVYASVQGAGSGNAHINWDTTDGTLIWKEQLDSALNKVADTGKTMTGQFSPNDVFNIRPCIEQHINTLTTMKNEWCRGFGSDESHVLCMLYYINECGRNWGDDLRLINDHGVPDYREIVLHVPINLAYAKDSGHSNTITNPDQDSSVRGNLRDVGRSLQHTDTLAISVGSWCGSGTNMFINTTEKANMSWGFGHCCNVSIRHNVASTEVITINNQVAQTVNSDFLHLDRFHHVLCSPHLPYKKRNDNHLFVDESGFGNTGRMSVTHVDTARWGAAFDPEKNGDVITAGAGKATRGLRESLEEEDHMHPFRKTNYRGADGDTYRSVAVTSQTPYFEARDGQPQGVPTERGAAPGSTTNHVKMSDVMQMTRGRHCDTENGNFHVISNSHAKCEYINPFFSHAACFTSTSGELGVENKAVGAYDVDELANLTSFRNLLRSAKLLPPMTLSCTVIQSLVANLKSTPIHVFGMVSDPRVVNLLTMALAYAARTPEVNLKQEGQQQFPNNRLFHLVGGRTSTHSPNTYKSEPLQVASNKTNFHLDSCEDRMLSALAADDDNNAIGALDFDAGNSLLTKDTFKTVDLTTPAAQERMKRAELAMSRQTCAGRSFHWMNNLMYHDYAKHIKGFDFDLAAPVATAERQAVFDNMTPERMKDLFALSDPYLILGNQIMNKGGQAGLTADEFFDVQKVTPTLVMEDAQSYVHGVFSIVKFLLLDERIINDTSKSVPLTNKQLDTYFAANATPKEQETLIRAGVYFAGVTTETTQEVTYKTYKACDAAAIDTAIGVIQKGWTDFGLPVESTVKVPVPLGASVAAAMAEANRNIAGKRHAGRNTTTLVANDAADANLSAQSLLFGVHPKYYQTAKVAPSTSAKLHPASPAGADTFPDYFYNKYVDYFQNMDDVVFKPRDPIMHLLYMQFTMQVSYNHRTKGQNNDPESSLSTDTLALTASMLRHCMAPKDLDILTKRNSLDAAVIRALDRACAIMARMFGNNFTLLGATPTSMLEKHLRIAKYVTCETHERDTCDLSVANAANMLEMQSTVASLFNALEKDFNLDITFRKLNEAEIVDIYHAINKWYASPGRTFSPLDCASLLQQKGLKEKIKIHRTARSTTALVREQLLVEGFKGKIPFRLFLTPKIAFGPGDFYSLLSGVDDRTRRAYSMNPFVLDLSKSNLPHDGVSKLAFTNVSDSLEGIKLQLLLIKESLSASLGMYLAAAICEGTFLNAPYMNALSRATGLEIPGTQLASTVSTNHFVPSRTEDFPHTNLKVTYDVYGDGKMIDALEKAMQRSADAGCPAPLDANGQYSAHLKKLYTSVGGKLDNDVFMRRFDQWFNALAQEFPYAANVHSDAYKASTYREQLQALMGVTINDVHDYHNVVMKTLISHLPKLKGQSPSFTFENEKGIIEAQDVEYEVLKAHRDAVIRNYFAFANSTNAERRRMISMLVFRNVWSMGHALPKYVEEFMEGGEGVYAFPTELAQIGRPQAFDDDNIDLTLLYATDFSEYKKQRQEFFSNYVNGIGFQEDIKKIQDEYTEYVTLKKARGPFGTREDVFRNTVKPRDNPLVLVDDQGYPMKPLTTEEKGTLTTTFEPVQRGTNDVVERVVDTAYTAFDKMWKERIRLTNIHSVMEELRKVTQLDVRDGRQYRGTSTEEPSYRAGTLEGKQYREYVTFTKHNVPKVGDEPISTKHHKVYDFSPCAPKNFILSNIDYNAPAELGRAYDSQMSRNGSYRYNGTHTRPDGDVRTQANFPLVVDFGIYKVALKDAMKNVDVRDAALKPALLSEVVISKFMDAVKDAGWRYNTDWAGNIANSHFTTVATQTFYNMAAFQAVFLHSYDGGSAGAWNLADENRLPQDPSASTIPVRETYRNQVLNHLRAQLSAGDSLTGLFIPPPPDTAANRFHVSRLTGHNSSYNKGISQHGELLYNTSWARPQFFAMLDACAMLFNARTFYNPSDCNRGEYSASHYGGVDDMHYWCRTMAESFLYARQTYLHENPSSAYEFAVKRDPEHAFPSRMIGSLTDDSFVHMFPLLPKNSRIRDDLRRVRALNVMWGETPGYRATTHSVAQGAWMPLSQYHTVELYKAAGLFDEKYNVPSNCWCAHNGNGISRVFNQSYHSVYHTDSYRAAHFSDWCKHACKYQVPRQGDGCFYPFSQYGGTPVQADFIHHRVEFADAEVEKRHRQIVYNRFGITSPLRLGQQFHDKGILQDMFQPEYRPHADLSRDQRFMPRAKEVWISNFMAYARTHSIIALASCNHGTEEGSIPRIVRNLYRLYVDSYECMGADPEDDSVPCVMGFLPSAVNGKDDRPVVLYAGSLSCLNTKLERFCNSDANRGERVCQIYKQVYLNDAAILYNRLSRSARRAVLHHNNFLRAQIKRGSNFTRHMFDQELIQLQDAYIEFLQQTCVGMLIESGASLNNVPLQLLEPRELEVSLFDEDTDVIGNDYLTPRTAEILKDMDFSKDNLNRTQLAILSLIPPNHRILSTLRLNQNTEIIDLEHAKKQIQKETIDSNKKVWQRYTEALVSAAFAQKLLEVDGPIDLSFDMSAIKDPLKEAENIKTRMATTHSQAASSISQAVRSDMLRSERGPESVMGMNTAEMERALQAVRDRVERDYQRNGGSRVRALAQLRVPDHVKRMLRREYE